MDNVTSHYDFSPYQGMHVLITGGLGFIGSNLAHRLVALGSRVTIVDALVEGTGGDERNIAGITDKVRLYMKDIGCSEAMTEAVKGQEVVFNLAAQISHRESMHDPLQDLRLNCASQLAFLDACRKNNPQPRIVYAGTRSQYGRVQYLPVDEKHPLLPTDINSVHKQAAETYHLLYNRIYGIPICSLRLTNTYGPRLQIENDAHGFLGWFIRRALEGGCIQVYGDGQQKRDLNYVEDVVDAFLLAGIAPQAVGEVFNLGSGQAVKVLEFAQKVIEVSGSGSYQLVPYPGIDKAMEIGDYQADYTKIKSLLGWQPRYSLEDGLKTTVEYVAVRLGGSRDS